MSSKLTILNSMAGNDFASALKKHREWNIDVVDLRDAILGKRVTELDQSEATTVRDMVANEGMSIYCLSTNLFFGNIDEADDFKARYKDTIDGLISAARIMRPQLIRLNAGSMPSRLKDTNTIDVLRSKHPWLAPLYREAIDRIGAIGVFPVIENEAFNCFLRYSDEFVDFFSLINRRDAVGLVWDVQNQWASGVFPTMGVYEALKPLLRYYHVKGGQKGKEGDALTWNVALEEADWDVIGITKRVVDDGVSPIICLNPPQHGQNKEGYDYENVTLRDLTYLRSAIPGVS